MTTVTPPPPPALTDAAAAAAESAGEALDETLETVLSGTRTAQQRYLILGLAGAVLLGILLLRARARGAEPEPAYGPPRVAECGPDCAEQHTYDGSCIYQPAGPVGPWNSDETYQEQEAEA